MSNLSNFLTFTFTPCVQRSAPAHTTRCQNPHSGDEVYHRPAPWGHKTINHWPSALCLLCLAHTLCANQGWKRVHRIPPTKVKRAGHVIPNPEVPACTVEKFHERQILSVCHVKGDANFVEKVLGMCVNPTR
jgi:hypothetical protein